MPTNGTVAYKQPAGADRLIENQVNNIGGADQFRQVIAIGDLSGTWSYRAGVSGTVTVGAGRRVIGIAAHSTLGGSLTIDGGDSIPVPANSGIAITPLGQLVAPVIVFTSKDSFLVETLT